MIISINMNTKRKIDSKMTTSVPDEYGVIVRII